MVVTNLNMALRLVALMVSMGSKLPNTNNQYPQPPAMGNKGLGQHNTAITM